MVDCVHHAERHKRDSWALEQAAKIDHLDELIAAKFGQRVKILVEALLVPSGDLLRRLHVFRQRGGVHIKDAVDYRFQEAILSHGDVPDEFDSAFGNRIGPMLAFVGWDGLEDFFGDAAFILQRAQVDVLQQEHGLFGGHRAHLLFSFGAVAA